MLPTAAFLALWELAGRGDLINVGFTSTPWAISRRVVGIVTTDGFGVHAWASLEPLAYGLLGAAVSGVLAGLILAEIRWVRMTFEPAVMALYCTPRLALLPVLIIWMGIGMGRTVVIVWLGAVFPILINTMAGAFERDRSLSLAARSFGATRLTELRHVTIPACLPHMVTGFRIGSTRGLLGVIVSEMYASSAGIGFLILRSANAVDVEGLMALAAITAIAGTTMTTSIRVGGSRLIPWRSESAVVV